MRHHWQEKATRSLQGDLIQITRNSRLISQTMLLALVVGCILALVKLLLHIFISSDTMSNDTTR
jgi:hypothetical protein